MPSLRTRRRLREDELRAVVEALPRRTRLAMLEGIASVRVIAGAYSDGNGGSCPMLAAHRRGGRVSAPEFAAAWDRFTGTEGRGVRRDAAPVEVEALRAMLNASLRRDEETKTARRRWLARLPIFRRVDDYVAAVSQASGETAAARS